MRIVAGYLGGRRIVAPHGTTTRPTSDRVREALFSSLGSIEDARVLDLYAGTGALSFEAISRGARSATCVERDRAALTALADNVATLDITALVKVVAMPLERALARLLSLGPFDLVFVDPPYADVDQATDALATLASKGAFTEDATIVLEHASRVTPTIRGFDEPRRRIYGTTALSFFVFAATSTTPA